MAARPDFHATIADHRQLYTLAINFAQRIAEIVCGPSCPVEKHVNADELFLRNLCLTRSSGKRLVALLVFSGLQNFRRLAQARHDSLRKLLRAYLLSADTFIVDIVSMNTVF